MHPNVVDDDEAIGALLSEARRIAVLGIKTEAEAGQPAYDIPKYLADEGYDIIPVPVYFPEVTTILERSVYRRLADVPPPRVDMVNVFRRSKDLPPHAADILAMKPLPKSVWLQLGIRDDVFADRLAEAGITVVQDRCLMVELRRRLPRRR
jgi:uncharacterized protein